MTALDPFILRAAIAGVGVAVAAGPLGCFMIWRRMAYFGDATAHAAVLGVALSLAFSMPVIFGVLAVALLMAGAVSALEKAGHSMDAVLGVLAHSALAAGLVAVALVSRVIYRKKHFADCVCDKACVQKGPSAMQVTGCRVFIPVCHAFH